MTTPAVSRRAFVRGSGALLGTVALEAAQARGLGAQPGQRRDLIIGASWDVDSFDPHFSLDTGAVFAVYDTLITRRPDLRLAPALATGWRLAAPNTWEFRLRPGVRFHNGDPFTSADVKFSIERTYDPRANTRVASVFTTIDRIEAVEPYRVLIHTKKPDPILPGRLTFYGGHILPKRYVEDVGSDGVNARPIGTGPLRLVDWVKGDHVLLEATPDHWEGPVDAPRVTFRPIPESAARVAALLRGEVDLVSSLPPDHVERVAQHPRTRVEEVLFAGLDVLVVDSRRPPLDNPLVKQALSLAIDRDAIVKHLWRGHALVPTGPIPRGDAFYDSRLPPLAFDPDLARRRLAQAAYRQEVIWLEATAGSINNDKATCEAIVGMWRDVGINAQLEIVELSVYVQKIRQKSFKGVRLTTPISALGDPDGMMWRLLGPGGSHRTWSHARFDQLGETAQGSLDEQVRQDAYREMTALLLEHLPWIPVVQSMLLYGVQRHIDWKPSPNLLIDVRRPNLRVRQS
jgi:peptide/nickel transport system substrate-binding protein